MKLYNIISSRYCSVLIAKILPNLDILFIVVLPSPRPSKEWREKGKLQRMSPGKIPKLNLQWAQSAQKNQFHCATRILWDLTLLLVAFRGIRPGYWTSIYITEGPGSHGSHWARLSRHDTFCICHLGHAVQAPPSDKNTAMDNFLELLTRY